MDSTLLSLEALESALCIITVAALILFQNCNWSVLEKSTGQASFEVLGRCLDLYIPTWIPSLPTVNALQDGVFLMLNGKMA